MRKATPESYVRTSGYLFEADIAATCERHQFGQQALSKPFLIVEIPSKSTERHDRPVKLPVYGQIETVQEIALVASDEIYAEVHRRGGVQWMTEILLGGEAVLNSLQSRSRSGFPISTKASHSAMPKATRPLKPGLRL
jgi:Uma2 family endonuclease